MEIDRKMIMDEMSNLHSSCLMSENHRSFNNEITNLACMVHIQMYPKEK
jgi:hypothetical protein